jgi:xanthine dehydrogenase accessory factor
VVVVEDREDMLAREAFSAAEIDVRAYDADELAAALPDASERDYVVIVTRDHQRDELALAAAIRGPWRYIGMIGSRRKVHRVLDRVLRRYEERRLPLPALDRVRAPIGLALGGRTPAEIAVSIVAELIATRRGGHGGPMNVIDDVLRRRGAPLQTIEPARSANAATTLAPAAHGSPTTTARPQDSERPDGDVTGPRRSRGTR